MSSRIVSATPTGLPGAAAYTYGYDPSDPEGAIGYNLLAVGEEVFPREFLSTLSGSTPASGQLRLTYWTCRKTELTTQIRCCTGAVAAAATPTLCRIGMWQVGTDGSLTMVGATANDTTLFAAAGTAYTRSWQTPFVKVAGTRYAWAPLVVSGTTMPTFAGVVSAITSEQSSVLPALSAGAGAGFTLPYADLPSSIPAGDIGASPSKSYAAVLP
jgi:hypothetical protein